MSDGDALLRAILAEPDEDTPRLMYADWLQENGEPERAEYIRVQVQLARQYRAFCPDGHPWDKVDKGPHSVPGTRCRKCRIEGPSWPAVEADAALHARACVLWASHADLWARPLAVLCGFPDTPAQWPPIASDPARAPRYHHICPTSAYADGRGMQWEFHRGFIESVSCSATDWFAYGDAIRASFPVQKVQLTTRPERVARAPSGRAETPRVGNDTNRHADIRAVTGMDRARLEARWPGVTFEVSA